VVNLGVDMPLDALRIAKNSALIFSMPEAWKKASSLVSSLDAKVFTANAAKTAQVVFQMVSATSSELRQANLPQPWSNRFVHLPWRC